MSVLVVLLFAVMLLTAVVLFTGMFVMAKGGEFNKKYGNKLMQLRVICQGVAIVLVALILVMK